MVAPLDYFCVRNPTSDRIAVEYDLEHGELTDHPDVRATFVHWRGPVQGAARELLAQAEAHNDEGEEGALAEAKQFFREYLANGPVPTTDIKVEANFAGFSWQSVRRAKKALGIKAFKSGMKDGWHWRLPGQDEERLPENSKMLNGSEGVHQKQMSTFGQAEHLRSKPGIVEVEI